MITIGVNVRDFIEEGARDCAAGIQAAIDSLIDPKPGWPDMSGGMLCFPRGKYLVGKTIEIPYGNLILQGEGGPNGESKATWLVNNNSDDGPLFRFPHGPERLNGFACRDMNLWGNRSGKDAAFELSSGEHFNRDFTWYRVGAHRFGRVIETCRHPQGERWIGNIKILECTWAQNGQALNAREARVNTVTIWASEIRQNHPPHSRFVFDLSCGSCIRVRDNCLEGQRDTLRIDNGQTMIVDGNYFEGQDGLVADLSGEQIDIGVNHYRTLGKIDNDGINKFRLRGRYVRWPGWHRHWYDFGDSTHVTPNPTVR